MADYEVDFTIDSNEISADFELEETEADALFEINAPISELSALSDVSIQNPTDGQLLKYNATTQKWGNSSTQVAWGDISGDITTQTDLQTEFNKKLTKNATITGGTFTKITYDSKGLVTSGADLEATDIPSIPLSKISDVQATATEINHLRGVTTNIQFQINSVSSNLSTERTERIAADTTLQTNITAEETARIAAITAEAAARTSADNTLQENIDAEEAARTNADTTLQNNISTEEASRIAADNTLQTNINAEETARIAADTTLQENIDTEEAARITAITNEATARTNADTTLQENIDTEEASRIAADTTLQNNVTAEETARIAADTTLQNNINAEAATREASSTTLQNKIDTEISNREAAVTAEATARTSADDTLQDNIDAEEANRISADTTLQNNINTEAATRLANDNTLQSSITAEETARTNADNTLQENIDAEEANRIAADTTLQENINSEATTRASADTLLQNNISTTNSNLTAHTSDKTNPHEVTKAQVGLGNVENLAPANMPISTATQAALDTKVNKNSDITGGTFTKITYDNKGLITNGEDLTESDIPSLHLTKISDVTASASEVNILDGATLTTQELNYVDGVTSNIQTQLNNKSEIIDTGATLSYSDPTLTLKNSEGTVLSTVSIKSSPDVDDETITLNSQDELKAIGTYTKDGSIKYDWIGTQEEYEEAWTSGEIESDWFCNITDDEIELTTVSGGATGDYYTKTQVDQLLATKQNLLTAGQNITIINNVISATGGGPVTPTFTLTTITDPSITVVYGATTNIQYTYTSTQNLQATAQYSVNNAVKATQAIAGSGNISFDIGSYLSEGTNSVQVQVTDVYGYTLTLLYEINAISLTISSTFDSTQYYNSDISFKYTPVGAISKTIHFVLDNVETTETVTTSGRELTKQLTNLTYGAHAFEVYSSATVSGTSIESNRLNYSIMYTGGTATGPFISSEFTGTTYKQGEIVQIPFNVYTPNVLTSTVEVYLNNTLVSTMEVDRTRQTWSKVLSTVGTNTIRFVSGTATKEFSVTVTAVQIDVEPVTENLELYLDAVGRSNSDVNREIWSYGDMVCTMSNFNFVNNGWLNNALVISNGASLTIPLQIFQQDFKQTGKTIEIEFATTNIADYDSIVGSCLSGNRGFQIGVQSAFLKSEQSEITARFKEDEHIRLSFVIEARSAHRLIYTYLNGIMSGIVQYPTDDDFSQVIPVNITFGSSTTDIHLYKIRVYNNYLTRTQVLNNWIADTNDITEKISRYTRNDIYDAYGAISFNKVLNQVPIMTITGELPPTKGDKKLVRVQYQDSADSSRNFNMSNVTLDIQGTSSQYYPKKNYKISKLPTAYSLRSTSIAEKVFTLKADYMESSHAHNTGFGKFIPTLYTDTVPPQEATPNVRTTIDGFPIAIYYRASSSLTPTYFGVYNFNNDKESNNTWGFTSGCESWEVCNNTSARCLFQSDDFTDTEAVLTDFEARYPADYTDVTNLHTLVSWIVSLNPATATGNAITPVTYEGVTYTTDTAAYRRAKFKDECEDHFNLNYLLTYYTVAEFFGMVDSFAKNLFLNMYTDGLWYPVFYDMDTQIGLNNEGVNEFNFNIEFHDQVGTSKIFNGESSVLWNLVETAYADEISTLYQSLRSSNKLSYDKVMAVYNDEQIAKICEAQYNEDAQFKYLDPLFNEGTATYLYTAQGSRIDHIKWWLSSRFKYMDSKYIASDYRANYITMRIYTPQTWEEVTPSAVITVTPYADQYVRIKYGSYTVGGRATHDTPYVVNPPAGITFNDTETIIYGSDKISAIGDISGCYAGTIDVSMATKLSELIIGHGGNYSNTNLRSLTLGNNTLLRKLDIRNCPNLSGALDVSGCTSISEIDATGTALTSVKLPDAGSLTKLILPTTITNLTIKNQNSITTFSCGYTNVSTLVLENTNLSSKDIFESCTNLTKVRLTEVDWTLGSSFTLLDRAYNMLGLDESGFNTEHGVITGTIRMSNVKDSVLNGYRTKFPNITFIVNPYTEEDYVCDDFGNVITTSEGYPLLYTNV